MKQRESGFALLFVFLMAAVMALMMYQALPRVAFEAQRGQEETLIDRGEQYKRAIQLYFRKFKRYPGKLEDLENTSNIRFLRRRYVDPLTGKSDWRIIHIGAGGQFTDSLINKNKDKDKNKDQSAPQTFITEMQQIGGPEQGAASHVNPALRRRPSDQAGQAAGGDNNAQQFPGLPSGIPGAQGQPVAGQTQAQFVPGQFPGAQAVPGQIAQGMPNQGFPGQGIPGQAMPGQFIPGQGIPGQPSMPGMPGAFPQQNLQQNTVQNAQQNGYPAPTGFGYPAPTGFGASSAPVNSQIGGVSPSYSTQPGAQGGVQPPFPQPGSSAAGFGGTNQPGTPNAATDVIRNLLTSPRPGGLQGNAGGGMGGQQIGSGIAGVASTVERQGIKVYNEQDEYNKWEFVYDFGKDKSVVGGLAAQQAAGQQMPGQLQGQGQQGAQSLNGPGSPAFGAQPATTMSPATTPTPFGNTGNANPGGFPTPQQ